MQRFAILSTLFFSWAAWSQTPADILQKSSSLMQGGQSIALEFSVVVHYEVTGEDQGYQGDLLLGRNDRFRLRTPQSQYQCDGVNLWQYNIAHKQVLIKSLLDLDGGLHPSEILFRYLKCKPVSAQKQRLNGKEVWYLKLDPKGQLKTYKGMEVWLDPANFAPVQIHTLDINGNTSKYSVKSFKAMPAASDQEFVFRAPQGVEEIDMR